MSSPIIFGGNNIASNLQNALRMANGKLITDNGPYNLIPYAQLESGLSTGWSLGTATLTSNFPSGAPTFGSGASGNLSLSASSSNPILGAYSLLYQSSAATTAGNFVASDQFSIPFEMQGKVLSFKIAYNCSGNPANANFSGTSSNSYGVAFWDATNSRWLQPAGVFNFVQNSGVGIATGTVQPDSTCLAGRLVIYNANATGGAMSMLFDDFYLGLQTTSQGPAMSDLKSYTPTVTGLGSGTSTNNGRWGRVGDRLVAYIAFWKNDAVAGTGASTVTLSIPSGLSIDTTKLDGVDNGVGDVNSFGVITASNYGTVAAVYSSATTICFSKTGAGGLVTGADMRVNAYIAGFVSIPIVGWSSNTVQSADTDTRVVAAKYTTTVSASTSPTAPIQWSTKEIDTHGAVTTGAAWKFTAPVAGNYRVSCVAAPTTGQDVLLIFKNGSSSGTMLTRFGGAGGSEVPGIALIALNAGDYIDIRTQTNTLTVFATSLYNICIERLSGPAVVQATDTVAAAYTASAGTATTVSSITIVKFDTKEYDTTASYNASTGVFTAPVSGKYRCSFQTAWNATSVFTAYAYIYKNGAVAAQALYTTDASNNKYYGIGKTIQLNAGDTVDFRVQQNSGSLSTIANTLSSFMNIERVGN